MTRVVVEADGGSRGNPGPAGYGAVVLDPETDSVLAERSEFIGVNTNNVAEYSGLIAGLAAAAELGAETVHVRMDSKLVVEQMQGNWKVKNEALRVLAIEAAALRRGFADVTFEWIPRERNRRADALANQAMDRGQGKPVKTSSARAVHEAPAPQVAWTLPTSTRTRFILVRHGATEHSADRRFSGRNELPLSPLGETQAAALARRATSFRDVGAVVSSPLLRCQQTARAIADTIGSGVETVDDFAEVDFGSWEGLTMADVMRSQRDELDRWMRSPDVAPPGGESFAQAEVRVQRARNAVIAAHPAQTVVVVTHVTPIKILIKVALEASPASLFRLHLNTASISVVDYFADGNCSVQLVNDVNHLEAQ